MKIMNFTHLNSSHRISMSFRFEDDESLSELDEEIVLPKKARVIHANVVGNFPLKINNNFSMKNLMI